MSPEQLEISARKHGDRNFAYETTLIWRTLFTTTVGGQRKDGDGVANRLEGSWKQFKGNVKEKWGSAYRQWCRCHRWPTRAARRQDPGEVPCLAKDQAKRDVDDWFKTLPSVRARRSACEMEMPPVHGTRSASVRATSPPPLLPRDLARLGARQMEQNRLRRWL